MKRKNYVVITDFRSKAEVERDDSASHIQKVFQSNGVGATVLPAMTTALLAHGMELVKKGQRNDVFFIVGTSGPSDANVMDVTRILDPETYSKGESLLFGLMEMGIPFHVMTDDIFRFNSKRLILPVAVEQPYNKDGSFKALNESLKRTPVQAWLYEAEEMFATMYSKAVEQPLRRILMRPTPCSDLSRVAQDTLVARKCSACAVCLVPKA